MVVVVPSSSDSTPFFFSLPRGMLTVLVFHSYFILVNCLQCYTDIEGRQMATCNELEGFKTCFTKYNDSKFHPSAFPFGIVQQYQEATVIGRGCSTKNKVFYRECETHSYGDSIEKMCFCSFMLCNSAPPARAAPPAVKCSNLIAICVLVAVSAWTVLFEGCCCAAINHKYFRLGVTAKTRTPAHRRWRIKNRLKSEREENKDKSELASCSCCGCDGARSNQYKLVSSSLSSCSSESELKKHPSAKTNCCQILNADHSKPTTTITINSGHFISMSPSLCSIESLLLSQKGLENQLSDRPLLLNQIINIRSSSRRRKRKKKKVEYETDSKDSKMKSSERKENCSPNLSDSNTTSFYKKLH